MSINQNSRTAAAPKPSSIDDGGASRSQDPDILQPQTTEMSSQPEGAPAHVSGTRGLGTHRGKADEFLKFLEETRTVLPGVEQKAAAMGEEDRSPLDVPEAAFATV